MARIIAVHSYRGGTGKSNVSANLAATIARQGCRVGVVDTDVQSPGIHVLFGFDEANIDRRLNDYLWGQCAIQDTAHDVTAILQEDTAVAPAAGSALF
jgi:MinD-like ATPase involved in chromosome partitioning or flagellar assembly